MSLLHLSSASLTLERHKAALKSRIRPPQIFNYRKVLLLLLASRL